MALGFGESGHHAVARLSDLFSRTSDEGACLALVEGPRGVGKNAVLDRFADEARRDGALVIDTAVRVEEPFSPLDGMLIDALAIVGDVPPGASLGCSLGCHEFFFQHPGGLGADPERALEARRAHLAAVRRLFGALGRLAPTVVLVRNFDAASADVRAFIEHLVADDGLAGPIPRLLVVGVTSDAGALGPLASHARVARVVLAGLDEDALREMLSRPEVVARILARTGGRPDAVDRLLAAELPSAERLLTERRGRLSVAARGAFDALAMLAEPTSVVDLAQIAEVTVTGLVVEELVAGALAVPVEGQAGELRLTDLADSRRGGDLLSDERRLLLGVRIAELLASRRRYDAASRHAVAAGRSELAVRFAAEAASLFSARHAHGQAAALLDEIRTGVGSELGASLDAPLADALLSAGQLEAAIAPARRAWLSAASDPAAGRRLARALVLAGRLEEAEVVLVGSEDAAAAAGDPQAGLSLSEARAELCYQSGRLDEAEELSARLLADSAARLDAHQTYSKVALARGHLAVAEERYRAYELAARSVGSPSHEALAVGGLGVVMITAGDLPLAERALVRCAALAEGAQDRKAEALAAHNLAVVAHLRHDYAKARDRYEDALRVLSLVGNRTSSARAAYNLGELYESFGAYRRARTMCDYGAQVGGAGTTPRAMAEGLLLRGRIALAEGEWVEARTALEAAHRVLASLDPLRGAAAASGLTRVLLREGRPEDAARILAAIHPGVDEARLADIALARAELAECLGDDPVGAARAAVAAAAAADEERVYLDAQVGLGRALFAAGRGAEARQALGEAATTEAALRLRVPADLLVEWEDRPIRREMLRLSASGGALALVTTPRRPHGPHRGIVGASAVMEKVRSVIDRVGPSDCNVLIRGESGTGKELVARALHGASQRSEGPLVAVNCAAIVESLLLSELFGHERGAFTGAHGRQIGRFEQARGGTLFLDEVGDVSPAVQAALLRVLSERSFERVGGRETIRTDVRLIAATNRDLEAMVDDGTFRQDLYYRLNELSMHLPPLRARAGDVPVLAEHILRRIADDHGGEPKVLSPEALSALGRCPWPGNVRQLENALRGATVLADGGTIEVGDLDAHQIAPSPSGEGDAMVLSGSGAGDEMGLCYARLKGGGISLRDLKKEIERDLVQRALAECDGNISRAAGLLGMKRPRLSQLVKEYGLRSAICGKRDGS
ncbi:MAG: sigma 54-interacting transcriptional regulator [Deltaproteobacteria bacterium]|nr:sigma 54-interacting transcriptional regulator [Deltaproteobacteria bacterium]